MTSPSAPSGHALPLAALLLHTAAAVQAVRAGRTLTVALSRCPPAARPGTQALSFMVLRRLGSATAVRSRLALRQPPPSADALLLCALALLWDPGVPARPAPYADHTVVDQAVDAARAGDAACRRSADFINAVLRRFLRERDALRNALDADPVARTNHPLWWIERLQRDWPHDWAALLAADNEQPPLTLRVNARRSSPDAYLDRLKAAGLHADRVGASALQLHSACPVDALPGFADGEASVQDAAAQRAAPLLLAPWATDAGPLPPLPAGARVLDACAAPGGKTAHLLESADLDVLALDSDATRLQRVDATLRRLGLAARLQVGDAADPAAWWDGRPFDAILLDVPCSASGVVRRHPDIRWLRRAADIDALAALQTRLLDAAWPMLVPGGRLLYCTCSVFRAEGQDQIDAFLQRTPGASVPTAPPTPGHLLPLKDNAQPPSGAAQAGPAHDGFFYALLLKHA